MSQPKPPRYVVAEITRIAAESHLSPKALTRQVVKAFERTDRHLPLVDRWMAAILLATPGTAVPPAAPAPAPTAPVAAAPAAPSPTTLTATAQPPLEEYNPNAGELFSAHEPTGEDLGIAFVRDGRIYRTTLGSELERIRLEQEGDDSEDGWRERERKIKRLVRSLPFTKLEDAYWPLSEDPTGFSLEEWERTHGPLLDSLRQYLKERIVLRAPEEDTQTLLALWTMAAAVRSLATEFAPRLIFEGAWGWGKTSAGEAILSLVPRGVSGAHLTPASVYRLVDQWGPVLMVDETGLENDDLLRVVRAGYKTGAKIIRAEQQSNRGVVVVKPFGWCILTSQTDVREDLVSRAYIIRIEPGYPQKRTYSEDPEALALRTVLTRLRLEILAGLNFQDLAALGFEGRQVLDAESRARDKLQPLYGFAKRYGAVPALLAALRRSDDETIVQLGGSDLGLVVHALTRLVGSRTLDTLQAADLTVRQLQTHLESILSELGESSPVVVGRDDVIQRVDLRRYGPRDFTVKRLKELGLKVKVVSGRSRIDLETFQRIWPQIVLRYGVAGPSNMDGV